MKQIAQIRRENLELLIADLGTLDATAEACGSSSVYLSQVRNRAIDNKTGRPREMGAVIARRLEKGCGKPPGWMDHDHGAAGNAIDFPDRSVLERQATEPGVMVNIHTLDAQPVSRMVAWEELRMPDLPNVFRLTLIDDSLAPDLRRGDYVELQRDLAGSAATGDWVLVRAADGQHCLREFIAIPGGGWVAVPVNTSGHQAVTSQSGATVVAVYIAGGVVGRKSGR